jgi:hypothetical protein
MLAFIVFAFGALASWHVYETVTSPRNRWMWCDCCFGECHCDAFTMTPVLTRTALFIFVVNLVTIIWAMFFIIAGASYYMCGRFECSEEKEEYVEAEEWAE